jgi:hypothetical protein
MSYGRMKEQEQKLTQEIAVNFKKDVALVIQVNFLTLDDPRSG